MNARKNRPRGFYTKTDDAYEEGAKVSHNGKKWVSIVANNVWEPGAYGWDEYVEPVALQGEPVAVAESPEESPEA